MNPQPIVNPPGVPKPFIITKSKIAAFFGAITFILPIFVICVILVLFFITFDLTFTTTFVPNMITLLILLILLSTFLIFVIFFLNNIAIHYEVNPNRKDTTTGQVTAGNISIVRDLLGRRVSINNLANYNRVVMFQGIFGKMYHYGTLRLKSIAGRDLLLSNINHPIQFMNLLEGMLEQINKPMGFQ